MALTIVWTKRAIAGYEQIIRYLDFHWTEREVRKFIQESDDFFALLVQYPEILQKTNKRKHVYRGPLNKLTIITYRIKPRKQQIEIINIRQARQRAK